MKQIGLNELAQYSPWPARLLGLAPFTPEKRTLKKILREYDRDKYGSFLSHLKKHPRMSMEDMRWFERGRPKSQRMCMSIGDTLYLERADKVFAAEQRILAASLKPRLAQADMLIELGAGFGYHIEQLSKLHTRVQCIGGEVAPRGIALGKQLLSQATAAMVPFDFYRTSWPIFDNCVGKRTVVLTYHSVEMLPDARLFVDRLRKYKKNISDVVQFEPLYELMDVCSVLGQMRRKYILMNNYNANLLSTLQHTKDVVIKEVKQDVIGTNPLFPLSLIRWNFR